MKQLILLSYKRLIKLFTEREVSCRTW